MLHSLIQTNFFPKYVTICVILIGFLNFFNNSRCIYAEALIHSPKTTFKPSFITPKPIGLVNKSNNSRFSTFANPVDRESQFTHVEYQATSDFLSNCINRSMISQTTDFVKLDELFNQYEKTNFNTSMCSSVYYGTLFQLLFLRKFLSKKFNVILVIGGGTTLVGDPSYKLRKKRHDPLFYSEFIMSGKKGTFDKSRENEITSIATKILSQPLKIDGETIIPNVYKVSNLDSDIDLSSKMCNPYNVFVFNNRDLYRNINLMEYLETIARNMNVGRMLSRDCIKMRIVGKDREDGRRSVNMDLSELMYMSLQAMDFVYLSQKFNCKIQLGGNDQMGNIVTGIELADSLGISNVYGITTPLLKDKFGEKISKSGSNCFLKITKETSPHEFWSHFRSVDDSNVENYIKWFTDVPIPKIKEALDDHYNTAKVLLADELTGLLYGKRIVELIHKFCLSKDFVDLVPFLKDREVDSQDFEDLVNFSMSVPHLKLKKDDLNEGLYLTNILDKVRVPLFSNMSFYSNKNFIKDGSCKVNGSVVTDLKHKLTMKDVVELKNDSNSHKYIAIQLGKRKLYFIIVD